MASRSSSRSEGEVLSSDSDTKAKKSLSSKNDSKVDRMTRRNLAPRSPHPRPSRSRSRSPYRAPRGEKRQRDDEHSREWPRQDSRTFRVRYENEDSSHYHHRTSSYDRRETKRSRTYSRSRSRSRSRSPYRRMPTRGQDRPSDRDRVRNIPANQEVKNSHTPIPNTNAFEKSSSYADRSFRNSNHTASLQPGTSDAHRYTLSDKSSTALNNSTGRTQEGHKIIDERTQEVTQNDRDKPAKILDESALIEERRKRREAIKNKYRGQATPLLVQALHLGAESNQSTSGDVSSRTSPARSVSPTISTPRSPQDPEIHLPGNGDLSKNEDLVDSDASSPAEEEPSAADYDPTVDMQDERARHDKRLFKEDEKSIANAEKQINSHHEDVVTESQPEKVDFDMFAEAEDGDDDIFAEEQVKPRTDTKIAQALDVTMMDNWDDPDGYYVTILGELIQDRYHVTQNLGRGMFSSVVRAEDSTTKQSVAIKIVRNNESMRKAGAKEIDILKDIAANDPEDRKHVIRLLRSFDHKGHLCMVFENLSLNLREVLKKFGRDIGISLKAIRAYAQQLFLGLGLLKKCQYLHADLKPDNILVNETRNLVKICDLGSASPITENATAPYLVSRFYRAPEVILGIPYDYGIDMWSIGCTLFELYTGKILFTGKNNNNMLRTIMDCRGKFPHKLLRRGTLTYDYFDDLLNFRAMETDRLTGRVVTKMVDVKAKPVRDLRSRLVPKGKRLDEQERKEVELFADLLDKCLDLRPEKRISPSEALKHPFVMRIKS